MPDDVVFKDTDVAWAIGQDVGFAGQIVIIGGRRIFMFDNLRRVFSLDSMRRILNLDNMKRAFTLDNAMRIFILDNDRRILKTT